MSAAEAKASELARIVGISSGASNAPAMLT
jgi:hypothetical protein